MGVLPTRRATFVSMVLCASALLLAGCFFLPGRFDSSLDLSSDGQFTFRYKGELFFLPLSDAAPKADEMTDDDFTPDACFDDDSYEEQECTSEDIAQQREDWITARREKAEKDEREGRTMAKMLGGIDVSDPNAQQQFAALLQRQAGWKNVIAKGDGLFEVEYEITSHIGHAFSFPSIENFTLSNSIVSIAPRADGSVRIDAPGFGPNTSNPMGSLLFGAQALSPSDDPDLPENLPTISGNFVITTDGQILANNTDLGPQGATSGKQSLNWKIDGQMSAPPMALIRLSN